MRLMDELGREPTEDEMGNENARLIDKAKDKADDEALQEKAEASNGLL